MSHSPFLGSLGDLKSNSVVKQRDGIDNLLERWRTAEVQEQGVPCLSIHLWQHGG